MARAMGLLTPSDLEVAAMRRMLGTDDSILRRDVVVGTVATGMMMFPGAWALAWSGYDGGWPLAMLGGGLLFGSAVVFAATLARRQQLVVKALVVPGSGPTA